MRVCGRVNNVTIVFSFVLLGCILQKDDNKRIVSGVVTLYDVISLCADFLSVHFCAGIV